MAETKTVEELEKEVEKLMEGLVKDADDDSNNKVIHSAILILRDLRKLKLKKDEELKNSTDWKKTMLDMERVIKRIEHYPAPELKTRDVIFGADDGRKELILMLLKLPSSSASLDTHVLKNVLSLICRSPAARALFGLCKWPLTKLLNPTSIQRSYSDDSLQGVLASIVSLIAPYYDETSSKIVQECSDEVMPFLSACLRSNTSETRGAAAYALNAMSFMDSDIKKIGESGVMKPLIELIQKEGDGDAAMAIMNICKEAEIRERAVSEGAVIAVMDAIRSGRFVDQMLDTLEMLTRNEKAIEAIKEDKVALLQCLIMILMERGEEHFVTMTIIHRMYDDREIDEAREKARVLFSRLQPDLVD